MNLAVSCTPASENDPACPSKGYDFVIAGTDGSFTQQFQQVFRTWPLANNAVFCAREELADVSCDDVVGFAARTCNREDSQDGCGIIIGGGNDGPSASELCVLVDGEEVLMVDDAVQIKCLEQAVTLSTRGDHVLTAQAFLNRKKAASTVWTDPVSGEVQENLVGSFFGLDTAGLVGLSQPLFVAAEATTVCGAPKAPTELLVRQVSYAANGAAGIGAGGPAVRATWVNGEDPYEFSVNLYLDGAPLDALAGNAVTALVNVSAGERQIGVQGDSDLAEGPSEITTQTFTVLDTSPVDVAVTGLECNWSPDDGGTAAITWEAPAGAFAVDIYIKAAGGAQFGFFGSRFGLQPGLAFSPVAVDTQFLLQFFAQSNNQLYGLPPLTVCGVDAVGGGRFPGDVNEDGGVDISDPVGLLGHLFLGVPEELPCEGGTTRDAGNRSLLDWNGSGEIDISDASFALSHLFLGTTGHVLGPFTVCIRMEGCEEQCVP